MSWHLVVHGFDWLTWALLQWAREEEVPSQRNGMISLKWVLSYSQVHVSFFSFSLISDTLWHIWWLNVLWQTCCCCSFSFHVFILLFNDSKDIATITTCTESIYTRSLLKSLQDFIQKGMYLVNCHMSELTFRDNVYTSVYTSLRCVPKLNSAINFEHNSYHVSIPFMDFHWIEKSKYM